MKNHRLALFAFCVVAAGAFPSRAHSAAPSAEQALKLTPTQQGVDFDRPKAEDLAKCKMSPKKVGENVGWIVEGPDGTILRRFVDTNGDNVVDQWSYYKDGVEVYRDIDSKFSGKADQYRWLNSAGSRWGQDTAGTGKLDTWKSISAEEVTAEVVGALGTADGDRFGRVLLTTADLQALGLGKAKADAVAAKIAKAPAAFKELAAKQKAISADAKWLQFSGSRPGLVPAGTDDSTKDIVVYENVVAIALSGDKHVQVQIGTLVRVGDVWKVLDAPALAAEGQTEAVAGSGTFIMPGVPRGGVGAGGDDIKKLIEELEKLDPTDPARAEKIQQIIEMAKSPEDRAMWYKQLADTIMAAVQSGKITDGDKRLQGVLEKVEKGENDKALTAYVKFRTLMASYTLELAKPKPDVAKIQAEWLKNLEQYITDYPTSPDAAEAMLQLGIAREYASQDDDAKKWYARILKEFSDTSQARKATGATARLDSVGKVLAFSGKGVNGETIDLASYRGKIVLVQYWASWCVPAKNDMPLLKQLVTKYDGKFTVIGVNLDTDAKELNAYLAEAKLPWPQIYEPGGQDSRPANALGIITVPTTILIDRQGKVVNRAIAVGDVEAEIKRLTP